MDNRDRLEFVGLLRAAAVLFVLYAHLGPQQIERLGYPMPSVFQQVRSFFTGPFNITQDFGWFGVSLFFLISGFVVTKAALAERSAAFAVRRLLRIYPAFIVATVAGVWLRHLALGNEPIPDLQTWLIRLSLTGVDGDKPFLGVEWTLFIEMKFYLLTLLFAPALARWPHAAMSAQILLVAALVAGCRLLPGSGLFLQMAQLQFVSILFFGQLLFLLFSRRLSPFWFALLTLANVVLYTWSIGVIGGKVPDREITVAYTYAIFVVCLLLRDRIRVPRPLKHVENSSYSIYLVHGPIGVTLIGLVAGTIGYWPALLLALLSIAAVSAVSYRLIETPFNRLAKRLVAGRLTSGSVSVSRVGVRAS